MANEYTPGDDPELDDVRGWYIDGRRVHNPFASDATLVERFDRWLVEHDAEVRAEERERCLKAVEAVQRAMRDLADEKDPEERLLLRASANGMGGALAAIRAVSEQRAALKGGK